MPRFHRPAGAAAFCLLLALTSGAAQAAPGAALKAGERACYGVTLTGAERARQTKGAVVAALVELHRERINGDEKTLWGALHVRLQGSGKAAFVKDGCQTQPDGALRCSIACDGGAFLVRSADGGVTLSASDDGVRVKSCGSSLKQLSAATLTPADLSPLPRLQPRPASECRAAMARLEKLLAAEEAGEN